MVARLGLADGGFEYSTQGDGLTEEMFAVLDQAVADVSEGRIDVPTVPTGPILTFDRNGNEMVDE